MSVSVTSQQMKDIDQYTINEIGIPSAVLMERAALEVARNILSQFDTANIAVICGTGNNGGDGIAIGRILHQNNRKVTLYLAGEFDQASEETQRQLKIAEKLNITIKRDLPSSLSSHHDLIVDALFGIGLNRSVEDPQKSIIEEINESSCDVVAVDVPSGLSADKGIVFNVGIQATRTYTMGFMKKGFLKEGARPFTGEVTVLEIGYPSYELLKTIFEGKDEDV